MNYIQHLTGFFNKLSSDERPNPTHVSLYMALFQQWNLNRFENPISITRSSTMKMSKIGSQNTYHKCLNDLNCWGYISYRPSHNPTRGSKVYLFSFDTTQFDDKTCSVPIQALGNFSRNSDTSSIQALRSSINSINNTNNKTNSEREKNAQNFKKSEITVFSKKGSKGVLKGSRKEKRKKVAQKKEKGFVVPTLDEVTAFFGLTAYPELEARKFFYHFQSNGWKVGGKAPMKDWHAAAHNWMLNDKKFNPPQNAKTNNAVTLKTGKNYDIPL
jgi:hypothetical protein